MCELHFLSKDKMAAHIKRRHNDVERAYQMVLPSSYFAGPPKPSKRDYGRHQEVSSLNSPVVNSSGTKDTQTQQQCSFVGQEIGYVAEGGTDQLSFGEYLSISVLERQPGRDRGECFNETEPFPIPNGDASHNLPSNMPIEVRFAYSVGGDLSALSTPVRPAWHF